MTMPPGGVGPCVLRIAVLLSISSTSAKVLCVRFENFGGTHGSEGRKKARLYFFSSSDLSTFALSSSSVYFWAFCSYRRPHSRPRYPDIAFSNKKTGPMMLSAAHSQLRCPFCVFNQK